MRVAKQRRGPTPRRRHAVEESLREKYLALYEELGREKVARLDSERKAAGLEQQLEAARMANDVLASAVEALRDDDQVAQAA